MPTAPKSKSNRRPPAGVGYGSTAHTCPGSWRDGVVSADNRDLNYKKFFVEGEQKISDLDDYTSHNTRRLNIQEIKALLLKLQYIKDELDA